MPKPIRHIFVCTMNRGPGHPRGSCTEKGCGPVMERFLAEFQGRNLWGTYLLNSTGCIGPCDIGPNVLVYPDGVLYAKVTPEDVTEIIERHVIGGEVVERLLAPAQVW